MGKVCLLFSGQGSQYQGMGKELLALCPKAEEIYSCGSKVLGFDLKEICFDADDATLAKTEYTQPAIFATSLVVFEAIKSLGVEFSAVAGHSLGEYAAMVASGVLTMEQGFEVIKKRAAAMGECAKNQDGAMCAVLGLPSKDVEDVCATIDGYVVAVNYNSTAQTVIAGESIAVDKAVAKFAEMGKKAVKLAVSAAFHSKLMQSGADDFYENIKSVEFKASNCEFYSNVSGDKITDFTDMPSYLKTHLVSPVKFVDELNALKTAGYTKFVECGPNKVLTGLVKKTLEGVTAINVENEKTFGKLKESLA